MSLTDEFVSRIEAHTARHGRRVGAETLLICPGHDDHHPSLSVREGDDGGHSRSAGRRAARGRRSARPSAGSRTVSWNVIHVRARGDLPLHRRGREAADRGRPVRRGSKRSSNAAPAPRLEGRDRQDAPGALPAPEGDRGRGRRRDGLRRRGREGRAPARARGRAATCNPMGAGKWRPEYANALTGANVVVIADRDDPGLAHAREVESSLKTRRGHGDRRAGRRDLEGRRRLRPPGAGHGLNALVPVTLSESVHRPWQAQSWAEFRDSTPEKIGWLIEGLLPEAVLAFIAGPPKKGKTWIGIDLALALATGLPLFGEYAVPSRAPCSTSRSRDRRPGSAPASARSRAASALDPDGDELERLHMLYRPRPFDLAELATAAWLLERGAERRRRPRRRSTCSAPPPASTRTPPRTSPASATRSTRCSTPAARSRCSTTSAS